MSNYQTIAKNPKTGKVETVTMLDDYYGRHRYGVQFPGGAVYREEDIKLIDEPVTESYTSPTWLRRLFEPIRRWWEKQGDRF